MTEIRCLYGTSAAEIFFAGLESNEHIEAIALSVLWKDGAVSAGSSSTTKTNLARLVIAMETYQDAALRTDVSADRWIVVELLDE